MPAGHPCPDPHPISESRGSGGGLETRPWIFFRIDWFDLLTVHGTLKSLLQHHGSQASIFPGSAIFIVQFSHPYMTTGKTIALPLLPLTFVAK